VFQRSGNWFLPRRNRRYPAPIKALIRRAPWIQQARRTILFRYMESVTAAIRNPKTVGRIGWLRSAAFMRWRCAILRSGARRGRTHLRCKRVLFTRPTCRPYSAQASSWSPSRSPG